MNPDAFFAVYSDLPRQGPGSDASTRKALDLLPPLPANPVVLDLGCGPGKQTLVLAKELGSHVVAIDLHQPYLDELRGRAVKADLGHLIRTRCLSMDVLDYPRESVDLIWSEGAIYNIGIEKALRLWRPLLRAGGCVAFTDLCWLTDARPAAAREFTAGYPLMGNVASNSAIARECGFAVVARFTLPASDWWVEYYIPLRQKVARMRPDCEPGSDLEAVLDETEREIALFEICADDCGYVFYVLKRGD